MDRRKFLKNTAIGTGALSLLGLGSVAQSCAVQRERSHVPSQGWVNEPARQIPVIGSVDVLVVGGGPAGVAAAVSAARCGVSVMLLERYACLGGLWTGGIVTPVLSTHGLHKNGSWTKCVYGFSNEICGRLFDLGMAFNPKDPSVDPEAAKYVMDLMMDENGVQVLYNCTASQVVMSGDRIDCVILECKSGRVAVRAKAVVDASGDGDIFSRTGDPFRVQKNDIGAMWRVGGIEESVKLGTKLPGKGVRLLHMKGETEQDGLDVFNISRLQQKHRKVMWERTQELRSREGCRNAFLLETPGQIGVRTTRVLEAMRTVTLEESMTGVRYDDAIGFSGGSATIPYKGRKITKKERPIWQIPYGAIVPQKTPNLLVAGRCFGFDEGLTWDAREIATCFVTGQAAGDAAALTVTRSNKAQDMDIAALQEILKKQNTLLEI